MAFGFTDLSYEKRMNMPFELGIMIAMGKDCFIVSRRKYSGLASISDRSFSRWIESNCSRKRPRVDDLIERYGVGRG